MTTATPPDEIEEDFEAAYPDEDGFGGRHEAGFLDDVLTEEPVIVVKHTFNCYCYDDAPQPAKYYVVRGGAMTLKFVTHELAKQGMTFECNHHFFEGFDQTTDIQFVIFCGS